jgi:hypothetical protein
MGCRFGAAGFGHRGHLHTPVLGASLFIGVGGNRLLCSKRSRKHHGRGHALVYQGSGHRECALGRQFPVVGELGVSPAYGPVIGKSTDHQESHRVSPGRPAKGRHQTGQQFAGPRAAIGRSSVKTIPCPLMPIRPLSNVMRPVSQRNRQGASPATCGAVPPSRRFFTSSSRWVANSSCTTRHTDQQHAQRHPANPTSGHQIPPIPEPFAPGLRRLRSMWTGPLRFAGACFSGQLAQFWANISFCDRMLRSITLARLRNVVGQSARRCAPWICPSRLQCVAGG